MYFITAGFFLTALLYAAAGFGGGSTYTALLTLTSINFHLLPIISLTCNLLVVCGSSYLYIKNRQLDFKLGAALVLFSVPTTWFGSQIVLNKNQFLLILGCSLLVSSIILLAEKKAAISENFAPKYNSFWLGPLAGAPLGLLAGMTGIGGGIFLAPVLYHLKATSPKRITAISSFFILVNSVAGLIGHLDALPKAILTWPIISPFLLLPFAVVLGGQIGGRAGMVILPSLWVKRFTATLIFFIALQLIWKELFIYIN